MPLFRFSCAAAVAWRCVICVVALATPAAAQQGPLPVDVATPVTATIVDWDEYTGRFEAVERVELRARVSGFVDRILFQDGQRVAAGDVLFVIDPRPFEAVYARAEAELQAAQAEQARATTDLERGQQLVQNRTVAESTLDERRAAKLRADAEVAIAEAALREAGLNLEFTEITAPFAGRISASRLDLGNLVTAGETVLATIVSTDPIHLTFTASEADFLNYARLHARGERKSSRVAANPVQARLIDETGWPHQGTMDFVANELDPNAGTITGRAIFENETGLLTPGLFARVRLIGSGEYDGVMVPDSAILSDQARKIVMTVIPMPDDNPAKALCGEAPCELVAPRVIELGPIYRGLRVIRSGLGPDDRVIVNGLLRARPGAPVIPQDVTIDFLEPETAAAD